MAQLERTLKTTPQNLLLFQLIPDQWFNISHLLFHNCLSLYVCLVHLSYLIFVYWYSRTLIFHLYFFITKTKTPDSEKFGSLF